MPGIAGIITKTQPHKNEKDIADMVSSMLHETFYSSGTYVDQDQGFYGGWICHSGSFCDCMPVWNEKKNIALLFFGENFADTESLIELKGRHHKFDSSNASYVVHLYEELGLDFLKELNGWFSGVIVDSRDGKLILFNDRYGMQKIFYHEEKDSFYFASEAKALLRVCPELRHLDMRGVGELISCECVLEYRTIFDGVFLLPAGSAWVFQKGSVLKSTYFDPADWENQTLLEKEYFYDRLRQTFGRILPRYFRSSQPIGISLTGGLDTRMLLSHAEFPAGKYPCYTFGSVYRDCNDVKVAREVAHATGQTHTTIPVDGSYLKKFDVHAERTVYITDGYLNVAGSPEIFVNAIARGIAPIRMTGNFGSEALRDIRWLKSARIDQSIFQPELRTSIDRTSATLAEIGHAFSNPLTFTLLAETPWYGNNRLVCEQSQLTLRTPYLDNDLIRLLYRAPAGVRDNKEISLRLIADGSPALRAIPTDRGYGGSLPFPLSYLSRQYHEFFFKAEYAYNYGMPGWLARLDYVAKPMHLEKLFLGRHKFYHFRVWYRDDLADYVKAVLLDPRTLSRPYLERKAVEALVEGHTKGYKNRTTEITQLLTIELIQRLLIEQA